MSERWKFTAHAMDRMTEMGVARNEVLATVVRPEARYDSGFGHPAGRGIALRGRLAVVYQKATKEIVTVLWRGEKERKDEQQVLGV